MPVRGFKSQILLKDLKCKSKHSLDFLLALTSAILGTAFGIYLHILNNIIYNSFIF